MSQLSEGNSMKDLLLYIARNLVSDPDAVTVTERPGEEELTLELRVALQELLAVADVAPAPTPGEREIAPVGGWAHAPVVLTPRG